MEPDVHYRLIKEIEKYPDLYNYNLPDYSNKLVCDKLWEEVAKKTNISVGDCKEKWRNIRSSFIRSRKAPPNGSRPKKTYYLADHLTFILPFIKVRGPSRDDEEIESIEYGDTQSQDFNCDVYKSDEDDFEVMSKEDDNKDITFTEPMNIRSISTRKRHLSEDEATEYLKRRGNRKAVKPTHPMEYFFLSILHEFDTMDVRQMRQFKIKVLQALDEIKTNCTSHLGPYSTMNCKENSHTHSVTRAAAAATSTNSVLETEEVNIQEDRIIKLENNTTFH